MNRHAHAKKTGIAAKFFVFVALVLVVLVVVGVSVGWDTLFKPAAKVQPGFAVTVIVPKGAGSGQIGQQLAEKGVVANANKFRLETERAGADGKLQAGSYKLATGMPDELVIKKLLAGPAADTITVTIPEGFIIDQIAARMAAKTGVSETEFKSLAKGGAKDFAANHPYLKDAYRQSLEGYLFPKTYAFKKGITAREAIEVMLDQFDKEMAGVDLSYAKSKNLTLPDIVTVASIIEREAKLQKERPKVAAVVYNRLHLGMRLQMCSTIVYVTHGDKLRLTDADLQIDSPYNTYRNPGLPPGPISNPGLASLKAAAKPSKTKAIYYVLTGHDGSHTFADNNVDFLKAKRKSKEVFGQ